MTVEVLERGLQATEIGKTHIHFQKRSISPFGSLLQLSTNSLAGIFYQKSTPTIYKLFRNAHSQSSLILGGSLRVLKSACAKKHVIKWRVCGGQRGRRFVIILHMLKRVGI